MNVGPIEDGVFLDFLQGRFAVGGRKASKDFLLKVLETANRVSGDVQQLCDAILIESDGNEPLVDCDIAKGVDRILKQESAAFEIQTENLTRYQMKALCGVARLGGRHVFSSDFIARSALSSAATAKRAFDRLVEIGILYFHEGEYKIFNPFLREWISRRLT